MVDEGLSPGQQVITAGQYRVQPGALVSTGGCQFGCGAAQGQAGMSDGISAPFIRYPIATSLLMAGILFVGLVAYPLLPVAPLPQVDFPTIQVAAYAARREPGDHGLLGGAAAGAPVRADSRRHADDLDQLARHHRGHDPVRPQPQHRRRRPTTCRRRSTPPAASCRRTCPRRRPIARSIRPNSPILLLSATSDTLPLTEVDDAAEHQLAQQISQISGVAQVTIGGQQKPAIRVQIDPAKLVAKGLSLEDVRSADRRSPPSTARRATSTARRAAYTIYANDQLTGGESLERRHHRLPQRRAGAHARHRPAPSTGPEDAKQAAWANGKRGVFLVVFKQPGANVIETVDSIKAALPRLQAAIPPAIKVEVLSDRTQTIRASVDDVQFTLLLTIALVVMVIFVFLRSFWATIIPSVTVPLALLGACALM